MPNDMYFIQCFWQVRQEGPIGIAERFRVALQNIKKVNPLVAKWFFYCDSDQFFDTDLVEDYFVNIVRGGRATDDFNEPEPTGGYWVNLVTVPDKQAGPFSLWFGGRSGSQGRNCVEINTVCGVEPDPRLISYDVFKGMLAALYAAFEPDWIDARPGDLGWPKRPLPYSRPVIPMVWMVKLSPPLAARVRAPDSIVYEIDPDGALFMTAATETFRMDHPAHMAAALTIHEVTDPLNDLPFKINVPLADQIPMPD